MIGALRAGVSCSRRSWERYPSSASQADEARRGPRRRKGRRVSQPAGGIGSSTRLWGRLKVEPADFQVDELPAYLPSGEGEHLFLWVEKENVAAEQLPRHIARCLKVDAREIGVAGLKDRRAITRQWVSVPAIAADRVPDINTDRIRVLQQQRHGNKLRTGHLRGNRFSILIRDGAPPPASTEAAPTGIVDRQSGEPAMSPREHAVTPPEGLFRTRDEIAAIVSDWAARVGQDGFANRFGDQRFGHDQSTLELGWGLLRRTVFPKDIPFARRRFLLRLALSAAQAELFNRYLSARQQRGLLNTVRLGDVMQVVASGGTFWAEDVDQEQPRCTAGETVITGPLFGQKMRQPRAEPEEWERQILHAAELTLDQFSGFRDLLNGARRPLVVRPAALTAECVAEGIRVECSLPPGVYATTLLTDLWDWDSADGPPGDGSAASSNSSGGTEQTDHPEDLAAGGDDLTTAAEET
jgi:tRNA pseudouridine13 synthase